MLIYSFCVLVSFGLLPNVVFADPLGPSDYYIADPGTLAVVVFAAPSVDIGLSVDTVAVGNIHILEQIHLMIVRIIK